MPTNRPTSLVILLDPVLDRGRKEKRWERWRPSVAIAELPELHVERVDLLCDADDLALAEIVAADLAMVLPGATVEVHALTCGPERSFAEAERSLDAWIPTQPFAPEASQLLVYAGSRTTPASIALTAAVIRGRIPGRLVLVEPPSGDEDFGRIDVMAAGPAVAAAAEPPLVTADRLPTRNRNVAALLDQIEKVAGRTDDPIVLHGAAGAGRSTVARWIHTIRHAAGRATGRCVQIDGFEIQDDLSTSQFGTRRLSGAIAEAAGGTLIIEHVDALPRTAQIALARRLDRPGPETPGIVVSLVGTLADAVQRGALEDDLLAMLDGWVFELPPLAARPEDIEPAVDVALEEARRDLRRDARFEPEARAKFVAFARHDDTHWLAGFRSLRASVRRLATLADDGVVTVGDVDLELDRLSGREPVHEVAEAADVDLEALLGAAQYEALDRFDRVQLADVVHVCRNAASLSEAGRELFAASRARRKKVNDADRVRKYLLRFGLEFGRL